MLSMINIIKKEDFSTIYSNIIDNNIYNIKI